MSLGINGAEKFDLSLIPWTGYKTHVWAAKGNSFALPQSLMWLHLLLLLYNPFYLFFFQGDKDA